MSLSRRKCAGIAVFGISLIAAFIASETSIQATDSLETPPPILEGRSLFSLSNFNDPATIEQKGSLRDKSHGQRSFDDPNSLEAQRSRCQIVYILGVEGTMHHGISPVLRQLAQQQVDPQMGTPYHVQFESRYLRYGLFGYPGWVGNEFKYNKPPAVNDQKLVQKVIAAICPNNGQHHVIIEDVSFPAGDDTPSTRLRVRRDKKWQKQSPQKISVTNSARNHPFNLDQFYTAYSPFAEIKFIVLHRPYMETIASHPDFDSGPIIHSNVIQGFLIILSKFLDSHRHDTISGEKIWSMLNMERLAVRYYGPRDQRENHKLALEARRDMVREMALFLGWPQTECRDCFLTWKDSTNDYTQIFSTEEMNILRQHVQSLEGVWPPVESRRQNLNVP